MRCTPRLHATALMLGGVEPLVGAVAGTPQVRIGSSMSEELNLSRNRPALPIGERVARGRQSPCSGRPLRRGVKGCWYRTVEARSPRCRALAGFLRGGVKP